jgi:hypothetical protein
MLKLSICSRRIIVIVQVGRRRVVKIYVAAEEVLKKKAKTG